MDPRWHGEQCWPLQLHRALSTRPVPCDSALERIQPRVVSFEEQVTVIREALAALHEREEEYTRAAQTLAGIDLDSGARDSGIRAQACASELGAR